MLGSHDPQLIKSGPTVPDANTIKELILRATMAQSKIDPRNLQGDQISQYQVAQKFLQAAHDQLMSNPALAGTLADKANIMFGVMQPEQKMPMINLLRPFLGHR